MPEKPWDEMDTDERLTWLRAQILRLAEISDKNATAEDTRNQLLNNRLSMVEEHVSRLQRRK